MSVSYSSESSGQQKPSSSAPSRAYPHNIDAERSILGALLLDREIIPEVIRILSKDDFYHSPHQTIYERVIELYDGNSPVDLTTLSDLLRKKGELDSIGGYVALANLEQFTLSTSAAPEHAQLVHEKALLRRLMQACDTIAREASEESRDVPDQLELAEKLIFEVSQENRKSQFQSLDSLMSDAIETIGKLYETREASVGQRTHLRDLDKIIGGFESTALVILAARPSIGKTALALNIVRNIAIKEDKPVAFFSLEMGADQLNMRLLCGEARISSGKVRSGNINESEWEQLRVKASEMMSVPLYIDDSAGLTLTQLRSRARRLKSRVPDLSLIVVDYLQLMHSPSNKKDQNRQQEVSEISRGLKGLAKELDTPVMALSQLSRNVEQRSGKTSSRPMLSDLRESGAIEQDADVVMFVHRERVEAEKDEDGKPVDRSLPIPTEIIVGKNRNGPIGTAEFLFVPNWTLFVDALGEE